jgi:glutamyl/glutaminyl-tRNA synthetase
MGFLAPAMVNYLALLGWNDGTEDEIFTVDQISNSLMHSFHFFVDYCNPSSLSTLQFHCLFNTVSSNTRGNSTNDGT